MNERQQLTIEYVRKENRILREQLGAQRLRLNDDQHRFDTPSGDCPYSRYCEWAVDDSIGRRVTDAVDGILLNQHYLIRDRGPLFTDEFLSFLAGIEVRTA